MLISIDMKIVKLRGKKTQPPQIEVNAELHSHDHTTQSDTGDPVTHEKK